MRAMVLLALIVCTSGVAQAEEKSPGIPENYKLVYAQNFASAAALDDFAPTDAAAWRIALDKNKGALELHQQSKYKPPYRSPFNIALIKNKMVGDVLIEADCLQTGKEYGHRDMVLFFGYQGPASYYYAHIATKADDHANNIFIVNNAPRLKISTVTNTGNNWGLDVWHKVRLHREATNGSIKVYFDDLSKPIMVAQDKTFASGWVGFGSFDDTGKIANIRVWAPTAEDKLAPAFAK